MVGPTQAIPQKISHREKLRIADCEVQKVRELVDISRYSRDYRITPELACQWYVSPNHKRLMHASASRPFQVELPALCPLVFLTEVSSSLYRWRPSNAAFLCIGGL